MLFVKRICGSFIGSIFFYLLWSSMDSCDFVIQSYLCSQSNRALWDAQKLSKDWNEKSYIFLKFIWDVRWLDNECILRSPCQKLKFFMNSNDDWINRSRLTSRTMFFQLKSTFFFQMAHQTSSSSHFLCHRSRKCLLTKLNYKQTLFLFLPHFTFNNYCIVSYLLTNRVIQNAAN